MPFEIIMGLRVTDHETYAAYRSAIAPLLEAAGARFRYDFDVARNLKSEASHEINRLFLLQFPDRESKERFFADPRYREIRARFFEKAVAGATTIAECST